MFFFFISLICFFCSRSHHSFALLLFALFIVNFVARRYSSCRLLRFALDVSGACSSLRCSTSSLVAIVCARMFSPLVHCSSSLRSLIHYRALVCVCLFCALICCSSSLRSLFHCCILVSICSLSFSVCAIHCMSALFLLSCHHSHSYVACLRALLVFVVGCRRHSTCAATPVAAVAAPASCLLLFVLRGSFIIALALSLFAIACCGCCFIIPVSLVSFSRCLPRQLVVWSLRHPFVALHALKFFALCLSSRSRSRSLVLRLHARAPHLRRRSSSLDVCVECCCWCSRHLFFCLFCSAAALAGVRFTCRTRRCSPIVIWRSVCWQAVDCCCAGARCFRSLLLLSFGVRDKWSCTSLGVHSPSCCCFLLCSRVLLFCFFLISSNPPFVISRDLVAVCCLARCFPKVGCSASSALSGLPSSCAARLFIIFRRGALRGSVPCVLRSYSVLCLRCTRFFLVLRSFANGAKLGNFKCWVLGSLLVSVARPSLLVINISVAALRPLSLFSVDCCNCWCQCCAMCMYVFQGLTCVGEGS